MTLALDKATIAWLASRFARADELGGELHELQRRVWDDASQHRIGHKPPRFLALLCGRRSGKTELCARMIARELILGRDGEWVIYGARTRDIARDLIWSHLVRVNEERALGWRMQEHRGTIRTPDGVRFRLIGLDERDEVQKVRGYKIRLAVFDEASTYDDHLPELIRDCLSPALSDLGGQLVLAGTPGTVCAGYWHDATTGVVGFRVYRWTVLDNPKFPRDAAEMLAEERERFGWTEDDPTYRREYMAEWVEDESALVYAFTRARNMAAEVPAFDPREWVCTLGCDYGYVDECGWVVIGSPKHSRTMYVLHAERRSGLLPDEAAQRTAELAQRFEPARIVGDGGGMGKAYLEEFNRRWAQREGVTIHHAQKDDKAGAIALLNGDLRKGELLIAPGAEALASEIQRLPWLDARRTKEHPAYPNHCADAMLYAWRAHTSYWHKAPEPKPEQTSNVAHLERAARMKAAQKRRQEPWFNRR